MYDHKYSDSSYGCEYHLNMHVQQQQQQQQQTIDW